MASTSVRSCSGGHSSTLSPAKPVQRPQYGGDGLLQISPERMTTPANPRNRIDDMETTEAPTERSRPRRLSVRNRWLGALIALICVFGTACGHPIADMKKTTTIRFSNPAPSAIPVTSSPGTTSTSGTKTSGASAAGTPGSASNRTGSPSVCGAPTTYSVLEQDAY